MKPRTVWLAVVVVGFYGGVSALAQNTSPPSSTNRVAAAGTPPPITAAPVQAPTIGAAPLIPATAASTPSITQLPPADESVVAQLPVVLATPPSALTTPREDTQRRLEPPTPEQLMEKYGTIGFLIRQPEPRNFVEMINPFAPAEFGGKRREIYNRDPNLKPGATLPRTFIRDGIRNEPDMKLISFPW